jgi:hypothetical protein
MQQLQINLRKYLNQMKANIKMMQLIQFKENHAEGQSSCEVINWDIKTKNAPSSTMAFCSTKLRSKSKEVFRDQPTLENKLDKKCTVPYRLAKH